MLRRTYAATEVTYVAADNTLRELPDQTCQPADKTRQSRYFRPIEIAVRVNWTSGETFVELSGPLTRNGPGTGFYRVDLEHYNDAQHSEWAIVRDAVGQVCIDRDKRNI